MAEPSFYAEDICTLKSDPSSKGIVLRSVTDVDTHDPRPQSEYGSSIQRHHSIPLAKFRKFLKDGIPPSGTVLVSWNSEQTIELIPTSRLVLLDRALLVGDVVKRSPQDFKSGTVISVEEYCTLTPVCPIEDFNDLLSAEGYKNNLLDSRNFLFNVPAIELKHSQAYHEGALIFYQDWVGRIGAADDLVTIRLGNGTVVEVADSEELYTILMEYDKFEVGDIVKTKKGNLRRGTWIFGSYNASVEPVGQVVKVRTIRVAVNWLYSRLNGPPANHDAGPPEELNSDVLDGDEVRVYDKSRAPSESTQGGSSNTIFDYDFQAGDRVIFKDLAGAAVKYDGSRLLPDGNLQGKLRKVPRTATLGFDMNVYRVLSLRTEVLVQWQDLSVTHEHSISLFPDPNIESDEEVWPGEIVITSERKTTTGWADQPAQVGVVHSVKAQERLAQIRWFPDAVLKYTPFSHAHVALLPGSHLGTPSDVLEDVSLYDIMTAPDINKRRGDYVAIFPTDHPSTWERTEGGGTSSELDWFGAVINLGLDGLFTVRLGALDTVRDVQVAPERLYLVYSPDADIYDDVDDEDDMMIDVGENGDTDEDTDPDDAVEPIVEYFTADGEKLNEEDDHDAWSTEGEGEGESEGIDPDTLMNVTAVVTPLRTPSSRQDIANDRMSQVRESTPSEPPEPAELPPVPLPIFQAESIDLPADLLSFSSRAGAPQSFAILEESPPSDHRYLGEPATIATQGMRRIGKEHGILSTSLPDSIFVRTWESRLDLLRVLIIGPVGTPYELAPFILDMRLGPTFPKEPPEAFFHSWTDGRGPINPNLYEDGKICLSLLGTWHTDEKNESWNENSTILQVLVSILGLVLVKEPYYNEAGFEVRAGTEEAKLPSALYNERTYFKSRAFITHALLQPVSAFQEEIKWLYVSREEGAPRLLDEAVKVAETVVRNSEGENVQNSPQTRDGIRQISKGAVVTLKRKIEAMKEMVPA
ncbi:hypothetical protein K402DRAFT_396751 [Aulographum hederae CBS 113979]|uniref:UBC core domain-containing protein n=1 Tax=Aulographum hederae CBS 113979 TaxID=1176131 RepID=A0A6G1GR76_9PEZI|nr:hypothetical protein K402DRAFT_396751 [Aulographum hederae CBS 113979]